MWVDPGRAWTAQDAAAYHRLTPPTEAEAARDRAEPAEHPRDLIDEQDAYGRYAAQVGANPAGLTAAQKKTAFYEAAMAHRRGDADAGPDPLAAEDDALRAENARLHRELSLPGEYRCVTCGFEVSKRVLRASDGEVGVDPREHHEVCPNGCRELIPVTYRHAFEQAAKIANAVMERASRAERALREIGTLLDKHAYEAEQRQHRGEPLSAYAEVSHVRAAVGALLERLGLPATDEVSPEDRADAVERE